MINTNIFREYDIRGIYDKELHEQSVKLIGYFLGQRISGSKRVAIGYDARVHSPILRDYLVSGLNASGCTVFDMGMVATPVNYFANYQDVFDLNASIMITGSHNPSQYNGFKITLDKQPFFGTDIYALGDQVVSNAFMEIEDNVTKTDIDVKTPYIDFMLDAFSHLENMNTKIVFDCGNGVVDTVLTDIFKGLKLNFKGIYCEPDGSFPNHHPDPSVSKNLVDIKALLQEEGEIAFAYDGDADRLAVLTEKYNIKGDQMALLYASRIPHATVIGEVKCSQVMYDALEKRGVKTVMWKTGHSNLKVKIQEVEADLACEVSGHIFFKHRYFGYDDAIYATLRMLELIDDGMNLNQEIERLPKVFSTEEIQIKTTEEQKFMLIERLKSLLESPLRDFPKIVKVITIDGLRIHFENGWGLVRASNTTPVLVTRFEAIDENHLNIYQEQINRLISLAKESLA